MVNMIRVEGLCWKHSVCDQYYPVIDHSNVFVDRLYKRVVYNVFFYNALPVFGTGGPCNFVWNVCKIDLEIRAIQ